MVSAYPNRYYMYIAEIMSDNVSEKTSYLNVSALNADMYFGEIIMKLMERIIPLPIIGHPVMQLLL